MMLPSLDEAVVWTQKKLYKTRQSCHWENHQVNRYVIKSLRQSWTWKKIVGNMNHWGKNNRNHAWISRFKWFRFYPCPAPSVWSGGDENSQKGKTITLSSHEFRSSSYPYYYTFSLFCWLFSFSDFSFPFLSSLLSLLCPLFSFSD